MFAHLLGIFAHLFGQALIIEQVTTRESPAWRLDADPPAAGGCDHAPVLLACLYKPDPVT